MQNIFIVPAMQHGRHAKPLFTEEIETTEGPTEGLPGVLGNKGTLAE